MPDQDRLSARTGCFRVEANDSRRPCRGYLQIQSPLSGPMRQCPRPRSARVVSGGVSRWSGERRPPERSRSLAAGRSLSPSAGTMTGRLEIPAPAGRLQAHGPGCRPSVPFLSRGRRRQQAAVSRTLGQDNGPRLPMAVECGEECRKSPRRAPGRRLDFGLPGRRKPGARHPLPLGQGPNAGATHAPERQPPAGARGRAYFGSIS